ncbi:MarR family winged helix-turn-helix transcriptional regulator [Clostridium manihotivorum]|uniref:MarR family transcriptional regulator n=1 Tax=Clostridium manihotivorum TaxID=2320868 RepID=A0A3R5QU17_9CLOT|nr:MarR family transcriptional regulator [Clostridium manihotivorum]QAA32353.1 MarR family transcriptional regulator [Clostridium manihotivorum]
MDNIKIGQATEVVQSFMMISKALAKYTQQNAANLGLTLQQIGILNTVYATPLISFEQITEQLLISESVATISIEELIKLGLVEQKSSQEDISENNFSITDKGKEISKKSIQNPSSYLAMASALEKLSAKDIDTLLRIHKEICNVL